MNDALWKYVGQISGVLTICGAFIVILTALSLTVVNYFFHTRISTAEVTWASFLAGVAVAGLISFVYGIALNRKIVGGGDQNRQASLAWISGLALVVVAGCGFWVPSTGGAGSASRAGHSCPASSSAARPNTSSAASR